MHLDQLYADISVPPGRVSGPRAYKAAAHETRRARSAAREALYTRPGGRRSRANGNRIGREIINEHRATGVHAELSVQGCKPFPSRDPRDRPRPAWSRRGTP